MTIGQRVRDVRSTNNMSLIDFAGKIGISMQAISQIENDKSSPSLKVVSAICEIYDVSADWLLFGKDKITKLEKPHFHKHLIRWADPWKRYDFKRIHHSDQEVEIIEYLLETIIEYVQLLIDNPTQSLYDFVVYKQDELINEFLRVYWSSLSSDRTESQFKAYKGG